MNKKRIYTITQRCTIFTGIGIIMMISSIITFFISEKLLTPTIAITLSISLLTSILEFEKDDEMSYQNYLISLEKTIDICKYLLLILITIFMANSIILHVKQLDSFVFIIERTNIALVLMLALLMIYGFFTSLRNMIFIYYEKRGCYYDY